MIIVIVVTLVILAVTVIAVGNGLVPWCGEDPSRQMKLIAVPWLAFVIELVSYLFTHLRS